MSISFRITQKNHEFFVELSAETGKKVADLKGHYILCCILKVPVVFGSSLIVKDRVLKARWDIDRVPEGSDEADVHVWMSQEGKVLYSVLGWLDSENVELYRLEGKPVLGSDLWDINELMEWSGARKSLKKHEEAGEDAENVPA